MRLPLALMSPGGPRARLSILIFHRVLGAPDPLLPDEPDAAAFEMRMRWVRDWFNVLPLADAVERLYGGTLPARALSITFDDGYADNAQVAAPILQRLGLAATFFVSTGFLEGGCMFNDRVIEAVRGCEGGTLDLRPIGFGVIDVADVSRRRRVITLLLDAVKHRTPDERAHAVDVICGAAGLARAPSLMMTPDQVRSLVARGMDVGAHTVTHPILTRLDDAAACAELAASKRALEELLGRPVPLLAYPNGVPGQDYDARHVAMARKCGFSAAVSTAWGSASVASDRYQLPRFTPWDRTRLRYGARLLLNLRRDERRAA